jgi:hypothetical protein
MLGPSDTVPVFVFLCTFLSFYCLQASNANTHRKRARSRSRSPRSIPGVCVWACVWVEAAACTWLMLGSCSGLRPAPCLYVSLYFLEVLCLGLCLGFYVWGLCFFLLSLEFVSGLVSGWKLRLALGSCSAHARGFGYLPCLKFFLLLCIFLWCYCLQASYDHTLSRPTGEEFIDWCLQHGHKNTSEYEFLVQVRVWMWGLIFFKDDT